jgi:hypothetical protein
MMQRAGGALAKQAARKSDDPSESETTADSPKGGRWPIVAYLGIATAFLVALTTALSQIPPAVDAFKKACAAVGLCATMVDQPQPQPQPQPYIVQVNDLFPQSAQVIETLKKDNIQIYGTFGSTSAGKPTTPDKFVVAIGPDFPINTFQTILKVCLENGLDGLMIAPDPRNSHALYIGALAYEPYTPVTEQLKGLLLSRDLTWSELKRLVISH